MNDTFTISNEQANAIASYIYPNIKQYIQNHKQEYRTWLKEQSDSEVVKQNA